MHQTEGKTCSVKSDDLKKTQCVKEKKSFMAVAMVTVLRWWDCGLFNCSDGQKQLDKEVILMISPPFYQKFHWCFYRNATKFLFFPVDSSVMCSSFVGAGLCEGPAFRIDRPNHPLQLTLYYIINLEPSISGATNTADYPQAQLLVFIFLLSTNCLTPDCCDASNFCFF